MSAPAVAVDEADEAIRQARAILAGDSSASTGVDFRAVLFRLQERGDVERHGALFALCAAVDRQSNQRLQTQAADQASAAIQRIVDHRKARPQRWAALNDVAKACFIAADSREIDSHERRLFLRLALIAADPNLAASAPPSTFEPPQ